MVGGWSRWTQSRSFAAGSFAAIKNGFWSRWARGVYNGALPDIQGTVLTSVLLVCTEARRVTLLRLSKILTKRQKKRPSLSPLKTRITKRAELLGKQGEGVITCLLQILAVMGRQESNRPWQLCCRQWSYLFFYFFYFFTSGGRRPTRLVPRGTCENRWRASCR